VAPEVGTSTSLDPPVSPMVEAHTLAPREAPGQGIERIDGPYTVRWPKLSNVVARRQ
jgi:hypothetical protein